MNASIYPVAKSLETYGTPPLLIAASSEAAVSRASEIAISAELPFVSVSLEELPLRLDRQAKAEAVWLEIDGDFGTELDRILDRIDAEAAADRFPAIIAAPLSLIDPISARIHHPDVELVFDGTPADRAAALALARWRRAYKNDGVAEDITFTKLLVRN